MQFDSRDDLLKELRRRYRKGTGKKEIEKSEGVILKYPRGELSFPAPNHVGSRHYRDSNGEFRSSGFSCSWYVTFIFDDEARLNSVNADLAHNRN